MKPSANASQEAYASIKAVIVLAACISITFLHDDSKTRRPEYVTKTQSFCYCSFTELESCAVLWLFVDR